ncbi:TIGR04255 family protein [Microbacterium sp. B35-30]|uniref:TIGR04255 family protein n=1 Tax=Microbacterium sp. B35-30 TaxID=1962642 RepID=UPI0013D1844D|nr:TIGR04255 family protein [Microbacterium sp. B35-30]KAF2417803.1 hypothetical protein B2K11_10450 [Microbacterium sp. B35-30]
MSENFPNAPLVELIAEIRWEAASPVLDETGDVVADMDLDVHSDVLFQAFGDRMAAEGYLRSERLTPPGYPAPAGMAVYRYSSTGDSGESAVFQIGAGVLTVNAIQPYRTWNHFRPKVRQGLDALIASWTDANRPDRFSKVTIRYIDSFGDEYLEGKSRTHFVSEVLGFKLSLPSAFEAHLDGTDPNLFLQFSSGLRNGGRVAVRAGHATVENEDAVVMDTTVSHGDGAALDTADVLALLDSGHEVIHDTFVQLTRGVGHILRGEAK